MKKVLIPFLFLIGTLPALAQVKEGKVVYERKINLHKRLPPEAEQMKAMIPEFQTTKMELQFNQTQSLFKNIPEEENQMPTAGDGGGPRFNFRFGGGSPNDATFRDYDKEQIVESRELGPKTYLIEDTLRPLKWKIEGDTMTINGYLCYKATTTLNLNQVMGGGMRFGGGPGGGQGGQQRAEGDTARRQQRTMNIPAEQKVEAWFTQDIETSAGPDFFFGLPGLIMKVIVDEGTTVYKVLALDTQAKTTVKAPTSGKKITREEYRKLMQQQMQGMRPPGGGGGGQRMMIINQ
jgi:GLPGLI family protein